MYGVYSPTAHAWLGSRGDYPLLWNLLCSFTHERIRVITKGRLCPCPCREWWSLHFSLVVIMNIINIAKSIKDEDAQKILSNPECFPSDWIDNAKRRLSGWYCNLYFVFMLVYFLKLILVVSNYLYWIFLKEKLRVYVYKYIYYANRIFLKEKLRFNLYICFDSLF